MRLSLILARECLRLAAATPEQRFWAAAIATPAIVGLLPLEAETVFKAAT